MKRTYCLGIIVMLAGAARAQWMYGTITDAISKKPIPGATITVIEISKTCTTDSAGNYSTGLVPAGVFNATVSAPDYLKSFKKVFIASPKGTGVSKITFNAELYNVSTAADTTKGKWSLTYRFPGQDDIEIDIKNSSGTTIRKMFDRSRAGGVRTVSWNGKDDEGTLVPAGRYMCKVSSGRLVIIRSFDWKGDTAVPSVAVPPAEVPSPPPDTSVVPAKAIEGQPKAEETPAPDTTKTQERAPPVPAE
jgi:hypothetical protein